jgi:hypothetical protein
MKTKLVSEVAVALYVAALVIVFFGVSLTLDKITGSKEAEYLRDNFVRVEGEITSVTIVHRQVAGSRHSRTGYASHIDIDAELLFNYNGEQRTAPLAFQKHWMFFSNNDYKKGKTIPLYINPEDTDDIQINEALRGNKIKIVFTILAYFVLLVVVMAPIRAIRTNRKTKLLGEDVNKKLDLLKLKSVYLDVCSVEELTKLSWLPEEELKEINGITTWKEQSKTVRERLAQHIEKPRPTYNAAASRRAATPAKSQANAASKKGSEIWLKIIKYIFVRAAVAVIVFGVISIILDKTIESQEAEYIPEHFVRVEGEIISVSTIHRELNGEIRTDTSSKSQGQSTHIDPKIPRNIMTTWGAYFFPQNLTKNGKKRYESGMKGLSLFEMLS